MIWKLILQLFSDFWQKWIPTKSGPLKSNFIGYDIYIIKSASSYHYSKEVAFSISASKGESTLVLAEGSQEVKQPDTPLGWRLRALQVVLERGNDQTNRQIPLLIQLHNQCCFFDLATTF